MIVLVVAMHALVEFVFNKFITPTPMSPPPSTHLHMRPASGRLSPATSDDEDDNYYGDDDDTTSTSSEVEFIWRGGCGWNGWREYDVELYEVEEPPRIRRPFEGWLSDSEDEGWEDGHMSWDNEWEPEYNYRLMPEVPVNWIGGGWLVVNSEDEGLGDELEEENPFVIEEWWD